VEVRQKGQNLFEEQRISIAGRCSACMNGRRRTITSSALGTRSAPFRGDSTLPFALLTLLFGVMVASCRTTDFLWAVVGRSCSCECLVG
jgi:hypothetical protein